MTGKDKARASHACDARAVARLHRLLTRAAVIGRRALAPRTVQRLEAVYDGVVRHAHRGGIPTGR